MGSAVWFIAMLFMWFGASVWVGIADMNFLGSWAYTSPIAPLFQIFGVEFVSDAGQQITFGWSSISDVVGTFVRAGLWDYSVLIHGSMVAQLVRVVLCILSAGVLFTFALVLWEHVPFVGRGST